MTRRCFISVDIDDEKTREQLETVQQRIAGHGRTSTTRPSQFHVTLNFIGDVNDDDISVIEERLETVPCEPFTLTVKGLGAFPDTDYIRVVWAGARGDVIERLASAVRERLPEEHVQDRGFHGHVTLMRVNDIGPDDKDELQDILRDNRETRFGAFTVDSFRLKESKLGEDGAEHATIREFDRT